MWKISLLGENFYFKERVTLMSLSVNFFFLSFQYDGFLESLQFFNMCVKYPHCRVPAMQNVGIPNKDGKGISVGMLKKYMYKLLDIDEEEKSSWRFSQWRMLNCNNTLVDVFGHYRFMGEDGIECEVPVTACAKCLFVSLHELSNDDEMLVLLPKSSKRPFISVARFGDDSCFDSCKCDAEFRF